MSFLMNSIRIIIIIQMKIIFLIPDFYVVFTYSYGVDYLTEDNEDD